MKNRNTGIRDLWLKPEAIDTIPGGAQQNNYCGLINSPELQSGVMKIIILFLFLLFAFNTTSFAQQAYRGGSGDGYASATAKNLTLDMNGDVQKPTIQFTVYPNPATTNQKIKIQVKETNCILRIFAADGKVVYSSPSQYSEGITLNLSAGTYFLKMENDQAFSGQKLIVLPVR
jgi:hypothetical protein